MNDTKILDTLDGWIDISEEGFALENAGREPSHLAKELVQNALDAVSQTENGVVAVSVSFDPASKLVLFTVADNGHGILPEQLRSIRTVFWTSKRDDPTRRGRMGRGFKEPLSMAASASVSSGNASLQFVTEDGVRKTVMQQNPEFVTGTRVTMSLRWPEVEVQNLQSYFRTFIAPAGVKLIINGTALPNITPAEQIDCKLTTELFVEGTWKKEKRKTRVELIPVIAGAAPLIYEMGIPVCPLGWDQAYHANVLQRVPMNPKRDMVLPGYPQQIHQAALPVLLPKMSQEQVLTDWVGAVAEKVPEETQRAIIKQGLGDDVVRTVPVMGRRDFNADAPSLGKQLVNVKQLPGGLGSIVKQHVPTAKQAVEEHESMRRVVAARAAVTMDADARHAAVTARVNELGGRERVDLVMEWSKWFVARLMDQYADAPVVGVRVALYRQGDGTDVLDCLVPPIATWSGRDELTLALDHDAIWREPFAADSLRTLIHEAAHHRNAHHGAKFSEEVEVLAGRAAAIMFSMHDTITDRFGVLARKE